MPKLRFPGFEGEWTRNRLDEVAFVNPASPEIPRYFYYIDLESVDTGILSEIKEITKSDAPSRAQRVVCINDILFQTVRPYQKNNYFMQEEFDLPVVASTGYAQIRTENNPYFLYSSLHTKRFLNNVLLRCTGSSYPAINSNDLKEIEIYTPCQLEQSKISLFMSLIDKRIEKQKQLIETVKKYKRGVIKSLFERKLTIGCKKSQWKKCYMGDVITLQSGQDFVPSDYNDNGTGIPYMTGASCIVDDKTVVSRWTTKPRCMAYKDDTLLVCKGSGSGAVVKLTQKEVHIARQFMALQCSSAITKDFCFYLTSYLSNRIKQAATGLIEGIDRKTVLNQKILLPSIDEQNKIASFLSNYDNIINAHKAYLACINDLKKFLLQQLFI